jgi:DNA repair protein RAD50
MKYTWTQHKKKELNVNVEGMQDYHELNQKKEAEKQAILQKQDKITEELRNYDRVLGDKQLLQSQIEMNITKLDVQKNVKQIKATYEEKDKEEEKIITEMEGRKKIQEELLGITAKYHEFLGEARNLTKSIQSQENELNTPQYKNIEGAIQFLQFQMITAEKISEAILARHDAIEESVMVYHNKKMEQINKVIKDLWKLTYKGKDIDTIEIKSDIDKVASRYHSFNYRIVFKNVEYSN